MVTRRESSASTSASSVRDECTPMTLHGKLQHTARKAVSFQASATAATLALLSSLRLVVVYVVSSSRRRPRSFAIGVATVFLVVMFVSVMYNAVLMAPIVFFKLSEETAGENDLVLLPLSTTLLNTTNLLHQVNDVPLVRGVTPRWIFIGSVANRDKPNLNETVIILAIDSEKEDAIDLGRTWDLRPLGEQEVYVSSGVLDDIEIRPNRGERILLSIDLERMAEEAGIATSSLDASTMTLLEASGVDTDLPITVNLTSLFQYAGITIPPEVELPLLEVPLSVILEGQTIDASPLSLTQFVSFSWEVTVLNGISDPDGKWPTALGNVVVLEAKHVPRLVTSSLRQLFQNTPVYRETDQAKMMAARLNEAVESVNVEEYSFSSIVQYTKRFESYIKSKDALRDDMIDFTDSVAENLGYDYPVSYDLPLVSALEASYYVRLFLDQIFNGALILLVILGCTLIYSLLLSDVEEKTYEYGMLRALGMKQKVLFRLLFTQSTYFAFPGIALGLFVAFLINIPINLKISDFAAYPSDFSLRTSTILLAVSIGIIMPIVSNFFPIRRALSRTLRDSLDMYHQVVSEVTVRMIRLENLGLSPIEASIALMLVMFGFIVYYLVPLSFIFNKLDMFLTLMLMILLGMLLGLSMIAQALQSFGERLVMHCIILGKDIRLKRIVRKNLFAHRPRSRKTSLMFTVSIAFVIFTAVMFSLQAVSISDNIRWILGADLQISVNGRSINLPEDEIRDYLEKDIARKDNATVEAYTFQTHNLWEYDFIFWSPISNLPGWDEKNVKVYGIERNFLDVCYRKYYMPTELDGSFDYEGGDAVKSLYDDAGQAVLPLERDIPISSIPRDVTSGFFDTDESVPPSTETHRIYEEYVEVLISEAFRVLGSVSVSMPLRLSVYVDSGDREWRHGREMIYLAKARAMIKKIPGFWISSYRWSAWHSPVFVTTDAFQTIVRNAAVLANRTQDLPPIPGKKRLFVRCRPGASSADRKTILNGLKNVINEPRASFNDIQRIIDSVSSTTEMILVFSNIVSVITSVLCFFILWLSFNANVRNNSWEFGVYRSIGLSAAQLVRIYVYEALCLVITSVLLGSIIGIVVACTLTLQFNLFAEMPFQFRFPYTLFFSVFAMSIVVAVVGSYIPVRTFGKKQISEVLRGT